MVRSAACFTVEKGTELETIQERINGHIPPPKETIKLACEDVEISTEITLKTKENQISGTMEKVEVKEKTFRGHPYEVPVPYTVDFDFVRLEHLYLIVHAGRKIADEIAEELESIIFSEIKERIKRKDLKPPKIGNLFNKVVGDYVSALGSESKSATGASIKNISYSRYITGARLKEGLPSAFYIMFVTKKWGDLRISVSDDSQITFYNKATRKGETVDRPYVKDFSEKDVLPL